MRIAGLATLTALAGLTIALGADRSGQSLVGWGPAALAKSRIAATRQIEAGDGAAAVEPARALAQAAPLRPGSLSLLGLAHGVAGDADASNRAMQAASGLGWRDEMAQGWAVRQALAAGEPSIAAQRMEALLRARPDGEMTALMLTELAADGAARGRLAAAMAAAKGEDWTERVALGGGDAGGTDLAAAALADRLALLREARVAGYRARGDTVAQAVGGLGRNDLRAALAWLDALQGPGGLAKTGLWDRHFGAIAGKAPRTPFGWTRSDTATAQLKVEADAAGTPRLIVSGLGLRPDYVAGITTVVAPGRYRLSWLSARQGDAVPDLTLDAVCAQPAKALEIGRLELTENGFARSIRVSKDCAAIRLRLFAPASGSERRWLAEPAIHPLR